MKIIVRDVDGILRFGKGALVPGAPLIMLIDAQGSKVIRNGVFYIDGQPAPAGTTEIPLDEEDLLIVTVDENGHAEWAVKRRGGDG